MQGIIEEIINSGSIVTLWVKTPKHGSKPIHMDHRMYAHLADSEETIKGREVIYSEGSIEFLD